MDINNNTIKVKRYKPLPKGCVGVTHWYVQPLSSTKANSTLLTTSLLDVEEYTGIPVEDIASAVEHRKLQGKEYKRLLTIENKDTKDKYHIEEVFMSTGMYYELYE